MESYTVEQPQYELTAPEIIIPTTINSRTVYVHLKPYLPATLKELQYARALRMAAGEEYTDIKSDAGKAEIVSFFWKHFLKLSGPGIRRKDGSEGTPEEHKKWLDSHPRLGVEQAVVLQGLGTVDIEDPEGDDASSLLDMTDENRVTFSKTLYDPKLERLVKYRVTHIFRQETEADNRRYQAAVGNLRIYRKARESQVLINYDTVDQLYSSLVKEVRGVTYEGKPCIRHDIDPWVERVPFWWKDIVLAELFKSATVKNA